LSRELSKDAQVFKSRLLYAANMIAAFWIGVAGSRFVIFSMWRVLKDDEKFQNDATLYAILLAVAIVVVLVLVVGRLFAMWPCAIALEPQKGIWVYAPPARLWIPLDEIVDIDVSSGGYGGGHVVQLNRWHGLVKQLYFNSLFFPHEQMVRELRVLIDRRDGVAYTR
jgi:hypothetical protein